MIHIAGPLPSVCVPLPRMKYNSILECEGAALVTQRRLYSLLFVARAALVKSRDMHWSLLAQRGQRDVCLSSLRMLIVADGANPCE